MDMQERHRKNLETLGQCLPAIQNVSSGAGRAQLRKFYDNAFAVWTDMDRELINCRRVGHITLKYESLEAKLNEYITVFQQWHIVAALSY